MNHKYVCLLISGLIITGFSIAPSISEAQLFRGRLCRPAFNPERCPPRFLGQFRNQRSVPCREIICLTCDTCTVQHDGTQWVLTGPCGGSNCKCQVPELTTANTEYTFDCIDSAANPPTATRHKFYLEIEGVGVSLDSGGTDGDYRFVIKDGGGNIRWIVDAEYKSANPDQDISPVPPAIPTDPNYCITYWKSGAVLTMPQKNNRTGVTKTYYYGHWALDITRN